MILDLRKKRMPEKWNHLQEIIISNIKALNEEYERYFAGVSEKELDSIGNPFRCSDESIADEYQDKIIDQQSDTTARHFFDEKTVEDFWVGMIVSYLNITKVALLSEKLLPFVYFFESGFSTMFLRKVRTETTSNWRMT